MLNQPFIVFRKELLDALRDTRSLVSSLLYALMGPAVVFMVSLALRKAPHTGSDGAVLAGMASVFTLVSAFAGGMNVAMDALAGERERRSLLPLLLNPVTRRDVILGKWLAVGFFSIGGLTINLLGFAMVLPVHVSPLPLACGLVPLALFAAALELAVSTICLSTKEAHTYLSLLVFLPMGAGIFAVFFPGSVLPWAHFLPVIGQQWQLEQSMRGVALHPLAPVLLGVVTIVSAVCVLLAAANRLEQDDVVYGS